MKQELALSSLLLSAGLVSTTAQSAEFASADCVTGLNEIGLISVNPQDVERIIALKADEQGASWYRIIQMYEEQQPDNWRVQAILYA
ncbi:DUF1471 family protease activator YjfN [Salmonella enterica]|uniref:DUF1471 family protease activator YjfN n=1 Tax=Salmonella enterica TaxID=28901 RepID=UPI0015F97AA6|nr:DUF1471 family protease activator YjfN [Salmonella enterica]MDJ3479344.1 DUF1471 family protease activator YjfN [Salmonella enterica]QMW52855.1 DUF1471 domain-containing protein [Salmonella enterica subsp. diarizonae serovar b,50:-:-]